MSVISEFRGKYGFLSNFWLSPVALDGMMVPSVEHGFQLAKTKDRRLREAILREGLTPGQVKHRCRRIPLRPDWEQVKVGIMLDLLRAKFRDLDLQAALLATGDDILIEGNTWHDTYWGECRCPKCGGGQNVLGKLLMQVRAELREKNR